MKFIKANWIALLAVIFTALLLIRQYISDRKAKREREEEKGQEFRERVIKLEERIDILIKLFPKLEKAEESLKKLDEIKTPEEIRKITSETLKTTDIPNIIDAKISKKLSGVDKLIATMIAQKLDEKDKQFSGLIGNASDYLLLGNAKYKEGDLPGAIEYYDKALTINPKYADALYNKGVALSDLKRHEEAIEYYDKALTINPKYADAWYNKGVALSDLKRYDEEIECYDKALTINPKYANAWFNKACIYASKDDKSNALKNLSRAIELDNKYKEDAKKDEDFRNLWNDEDFKKIVE
jgi:tetratricopeptide (TPR) repeat protein